MHWRRKGQPTPVFLPGESQGRGSLVGRRLWGRTESDTTEAKQQQHIHCYTMYSFLICIYLFTFGCAGSLLLTWLSLVVASRGNSSCAAGPSLCSGSSCCGSQAVARRLGSCVVRRLSCSATCGMFPGQEWNPFPLHWQVDS